MQVDSTKVGIIAWPNIALNHCSAIFGPLFPDAEFRGKIDSLYSYRAAGQHRRPGDERTESLFDERLCAVRWHDPDPARGQGRVMWFGFPLYYMVNEQAQDTFNKAIDWFKEETIPDPGEE